MTPELPPTLYRLDPRGAAGSRGRRFRRARTDCASPRTSSGCMSPKPGRQFAAIRPAHPRFRVVGRPAARWAVFHTVSPASPTAFAATRTAGSGAAPATACTASIRTATLLGKILTACTVANLDFRRPQLFPPVHLRVAQADGDLHQRAWSPAAMTHAPSANTADRIDGGRLAPSERFYVDGLGFAVVNRGEADPVMATLLLADRITTVELRRGGQTLVLQAFEPPGACYPAGTRRLKGLQYQSLTATAKFHGRYAVGQQQRCHHRIGFAAIDTAKPSPST